MTSEAVLGAGGAAARGETPDGAMTPSVHLLALRTLAVVPSEVDDLLLQPVAEPSLP